ncbi:MAG: trypsin-like serine protease [bacterium]|nr:trypsin-like serine protease [bacterium]
MHNPKSTQLALLFGVVSLAFGLGRLVPADREAEAQTRSADSLQVARDLSRAFTSVSSKIAPSVVQVRALRRSSRGWMRPLQEGSGVIVRSDGIVVTNNHVVQRADVLQAIFSNGRSMDAEIVGTDHETDLAVLRLKGEGPFAATQLDESIHASVGEIVLAMGNPMGLGHTVTQGIVAGVGRTDLNITTYEDFIQTDAVINPGNSGGPLINLDGEVVGINTAVGLASNGDDGIAFAIPSRMVRKVLDDILTTGRVLRGWIGIETERGFSRRREEARGYDGISRVKVSSFPDLSPARDAGLEAGDIVLRVANRRMLTTRDFLNIIAENAPGEMVRIDVWRDGKEFTYDVELAERKVLESEE